jgi:RNA polymerase sigma-70 factor (ECF subfamily)
MAVSVVDPDAILIKEHLGGERDAFDVLYRRYFPRLVRLCTRLTRDAAAAEDIAQETLVRAHEHLAQFDQSRPMWPWLKTIARNLLVDHTRAHGRELPTEESVEFGHSNHGWTEEREVLAQALAKLPPRQRTAVALRYIEDWDGPQAAEFLGLSGLAFRQILHRARRKLQTEYRKIAEPVMGAILVPVSWLRRTVHDAATRMRPAMSGPEALKALGTVAAINLMVASATVFGGEGPGASPSAVKPAPPNFRSSEAVHERITKQPRGEGTEQTSARLASHQPVNTSGGVRADADSNDIAGKAGDRGQDVANDITNPNSDVSQPEDATLLSVAYSPRFATDRTVFAAGVAACRTPQCPPVLFRSTDAGATWVRLPAEGFDGKEILLPPAYGTDNRIFAVGALGLEVSEDGGASFHPATAAGVAGNAGSAAISPGFNDGDPTILIGDQSLVQYRDDLKTMGPTRPVPGRGPLYPSFSPAYQQDGLLLVGGVQVSGVTWAPAVFRCFGEVCSGTVLPDAPGEPPRVRPAPDFAQSGMVYAFTTNGVFVSGDRGASYSKLNVPWAMPLEDVAAAENGRLFAAVRAPGAGALGELHASSDSGASWSRVDSPVLAGGVKSIRASGDHLLAALYLGGIACSADGGASWAARCPAA